MRIGPLVLLILSLSPSAHADDGCGYGAGTNSSGFTGPCAGHGLFNLWDESARIRIPCKQSP